ncbi:hypothetical protein TNCV_4437691 [Trichonephila clavipes]|nr:hypothetical protein TNCV_4437691 [Trichonephila clavipes]
MRCASPNGGVDGWVSRAAHVMRAMIPNVLQLLVKVLPVPGWQQMAVCVHFLRCGGLVNDCSVEDILCLVFVRNSQHKRKDEDDFEFPPFSKTARKMVLEQPDDVIVENQFSFTPKFNHKTGLRSTGTTYRKQSKF